ncbi:MAG: hypothetical protein M3O22_05615 [Pseudomonadota bacterium]|nr:hypothetical protein [Pseudomonadota bacterium]
MYIALAMQTSYSDTILHKIAITIPAKTNNNDFATIGFAVNFLKLDSHLRRNVGFLFFPPCGIDAILIFQDTGPFQGQSSFQGFFQVFSQLLFPGSYSLGIEIGFLLSFLT